MAKQVIGSDLIKAAVASYWRYTRNYPLVTIEADWGAADVLVMNKGRLLTEIEVKVSTSDLRADIKKHRGFKHNCFKNQWLRDLPINYFYFAVPKSLGDKATEICQELYPYAGLIGTNGELNPNGLIGHDLEFYRLPKLVLPEKTRVSTRDIIRIVKGQSGTVCRLATKCANKLVLYPQGVING